MPPRTIVFAIGNPSTDKDTFISNLSHAFSFHQFTLGPWLSSLLDLQNPTGNLARKYWSSQKPMPAGEIVPLLQSAMEERGDERVILDGFPRTREAAEVFVEEVGEPELVVYFETPGERASEQYRGVVRERFDDVGGEEERELVEKRFREHESEMSGLVEYLEGMGRFVKICVPDDSEESYGKVLETLRAHEVGRRLFD